MKCAHFTCHACKDVDLDTARAEVAALRARIADYEVDHRAVVAGLCASDERHCSCVPHLRREVERLRSENERLRARKP